MRQTETETNVFLFWFIIIIYFENVLFFFFIHSFFISFHTLEIIGALQTFFTL